MIFRRPLCPPIGKSEGKWSPSSLTNVPRVLVDGTWDSADITADNCLDYWVDDVASTGTFIKNAAAGSNVDSVAPPGWIIKTNIPD